MLAAAFFTVIFSSLVWLIFAIRFINDALAGISFFEAGIANVLLYALLVCAPIFLIWSVFGQINQYFCNRNINLQLRKLMSQAKRNQDYSDLLARALIETEGHIKDGFVLGKFDLLIADMNELLSEIIRNCKIASAEQIENLWSRVQNGGKWAFGKVIIEVNNSQPNFRKRIFEKASFDNILAGTIMEFCARYASVIKMLERHDSDKVFLKMIENGIMGKVFSILAPISDELRRNRETAQIFAEEDDEEERPQPPRKKAPKRLPLAASQSLRAERPVSGAAHAKLSFLDKLGNLRKKKIKGSIEPVFRDEKDAFSLALEKSFSEDEEILPPPAEEEPLPPEMPAAEEITQDPDEQFFAETTPTADISPAEEKPADAMMTDTQKTLDSLKKEWAQMETKETSPFVSRAKTGTDNEEENFIYPFGSWADEKNYQK